MKRPRHIFELIIILIVAIGFNLDRIAPKFSDFSIFITTIFFILWIIVVLTSEDKFKFARFGYTLILIRIVTPIFTIILTIIFYKFIYEPPKTKETIRLEQKVDSLKCSSIRYGSFKTLNDTVLRYKSENNDFEIHNGIDTFKVCWIDSCMYRILKPSGFFELYRIIRINDRFITIERIKNDLKREVLIQEKIN